MHLNGEPSRLTGRKMEIFEIVVEEFIRSAKPVGSEFLAENYDLEVSSATVRNDLAYLEELGFLTKPHTSGGRIPTANGWHYFLEEIWEPSYSSESEMLRFRNLISNFLNTSLEIKKCVSNFFPEASDKFLEGFLIKKLFNEKHGRRK